MVSKPDVKSSSSDDEEGPEDSDEEYTEADDDDIESSKSNSKKTTDKDESSSESESEEEEDEEEESDEEDSEDEQPSKPSQQQPRDETRPKAASDPRVIMEEDESSESINASDTKETKKILWTPQFSGSVKDRVKDIETQVVTTPALSRSNSKGSFPVASKPIVTGTTGTMNADTVDKSPKTNHLQPSTPAKSGRTSPVGEWFKAVVAKPYEPHLGFPRLCRSKTMPSVFGHTNFTPSFERGGDSLANKTVANCESGPTEGATDGKSDSRPPWVSQRKIKQMVESGTPWWARAQSIDAGERIAPVISGRSASMSRKSSVPHVPWSVTPKSMTTTNTATTRPFSFSPSQTSPSSAFRPPVKTTTPASTGPKSPIKKSASTALATKAPSCQVAQLVETQILHYPNATLPTFEKIIDHHSSATGNTDPTVLDPKIKARNVLVKKVPSSPPVQPPDNIHDFSGTKTSNTKDTNDLLKFAVRPVKQQVLRTEIESVSSSSDLSSSDLSSPVATTLQKQQQPQQQELKIPPPLTINNLKGFAPSSTTSSTLDNNGHRVHSLAKEFESPATHHLGHNISHAAEGGAKVARLQKQFGRAQSFESPPAQKPPNHQQKPPSPMFNQKELKIPPPLSIENLNGTCGASSKRGKTSSSAGATSVRPDFLARSSSDVKKDTVLPFTRDTHVTHGIVASRLQEHVKRASSPVDNQSHHPHQNHSSNSRSSNSPQQHAATPIVDSFFSKLGKSAESLKIPTGLQKRPPSPVRPTFDFFNGGAGGPKQQVRDFPGVFTQHANSVANDVKHFPVIRKDNSGHDVPNALSGTSGRLSPQTMKKDEKLAELRMRYPFVNPDTLFEVNLVKNSRGLGICISDDGSAIPFIRIKTLYPLQPALECGKLLVGDIVLCVNKLHLTWLNHNDAVDALRVAPNEVCLTMCRPPPGTLPPIPQEFDVVMEKWGGSLGFTLHNRDDRHKHPGHFIKELVKDPALTDGRLQPGDELVMVNGVDVRVMSHAETIQFLRTSPATVTLSIRRDIEPPSSPVSPMSPMEPFPLSESPTTRGDKKVLRKEAQDLLSDKSRRKNGDSSISPFGSPKSRRQRRRAAGGHTSPSELSASPSTLSGDSTGDLTADLTTESCCFSTASEGLDSRHGTPLLPHHTAANSDHLVDSIRQQLHKQSSFGAPTPSPRGPSPSSSFVKLPRPNSLDLNGSAEFQERAAIFGSIRPKVCGSVVSSVPALCVSKYDSSDGTTTTTTASETDSDGLPPAANLGTPLQARAGLGSPKLPQHRHVAPPTPTSATPAKNSFTEQLRQSLASSVLAGRGPCTAEDLTRSPPEVGSTTGSSFRAGLSLQQPLRTSTPNAPPAFSRAATITSAVEQMKQELFTVELERTSTNNRLGFSLFAVNTSNFKGTFVRAVHPGSIAYQDGRLRPGDELLKVNGIYVGHTTTDDIIELLRVQKGKIALEVLRNPAILNTVLAEMQ